MRVTIRNGEHYYYAAVTVAWARRHDNGALISCGLTVGRDGFTERAFKTLLRRGALAEIPRETWNHSSCQSSCKLRGDQACRW